MAIVKRFVSGDYMGHPDRDPNAKASTADGNPAYTAFRGFVTQTMVDRYGSYPAARRALDWRQDNGF